MKSPQVSCHKRGHAEKRSLENIQEDYDKFVADGSVTSRQKFYHNVIHEKLLDIELDKVRYKSLFYCFEGGHTGHLTNGSLFQVCVPGLQNSLGVFKKPFDELENQCFELGKKIQMVLAGDSEENDDEIQVFRAAQLHTRQAQQFNEKANYLQALLNLASLHANVNIMPAYFTLLQKEINKLFGNAKEEVTIIYLCFPVSKLYNPPIPSHMFQTHLNFLVKEVMILFYRSFVCNITLAQIIKL